MKRTIAVMATVLIVASLGVGYVVGRSGGGDTGDSISSRLGNLISPAPSAQRFSPASGTPAGGTAASAAVPDPPPPLGTPNAGPAPATPAIAAPPVPADPATPMVPATPRSSPATFGLIRDDRAPGTPGLLTPVARSPQPEVAGVGTPTTSNAVPGATSLVRPSASASASVSASASSRPAAIGGDGIPIQYETPAPGT